MKDFKVIHTICQPSVLFLEIMKSWKIGLQQMYNAPNSSSKQGGPRATPSNDTHIKRHSQDMRYQYLVKRFEMKIYLSIAFCLLLASSGKYFISHNFISHIQANIGTQVRCLLFWFLISMIFLRLSGILCGITSSLRIRKNFFDFS